VPVGRAGSDGRINARRGEGFGTARPKRKRRRRRRRRRRRTSGCSRGY
jgi:hypothetical protein